MVTANEVEEVNRKVKKKSDIYDIICMVSSSEVEKGNSKVKKNMTS